MCLQCRMHECHYSKSSWTWSQKNNYIEIFIWRLYASLFVSLSFLLFPHVWLSPSARVRRGRGSAVLIELTSPLQGFSPCNTAWRGSQLRKGEAGKTHGSYFGIDEIADIMYGHVCLKGAEKGKKGKACVSLCFPTKPHSLDSDSVPSHRSFFVNYLTQQGRPQHPESKAQQYIYILRIYIFTYVYINIFCFFKSM